MNAHHRRNRTGLAVLVLVSLVLLTVDYRQGQTGVVAALQRGAVTVFSPVQEGLATVIRPIGSAVGSLVELGTLRRRNAELEAELERLRALRVSMTDLQRENAELRGALDLRDRTGLTTAGARVIAQPPNAFDHTVLVDVGASSGVAVGMAVLNADGLVGKLVQVTARNARVQLLTSPEASYAARVAATGEEGLLSGSGSRPFQLEVFDPEVRVARGEEVVTHAFAGSSIPDGVPIGVVEGPVDPDASARFLAVRPFVDFTRLSTVQVVLDAPVNPSELADDELVDPPDGVRPAPPDPGSDEGTPRG